MNFKLVFITLLASNQIGMNGALRIDINPDKYSGILSDSVQISCLPDGSDFKVKEVVLMEIYRNGESPLAVLHQNSNISLRADVMNHFEAQGHIDNDPSKCYFNLTIVDPRRRDTGVYTCIMFYLDQNGVFGQEKASDVLKVEKTDISTLETVVKNLYQKVSLLENDVKGDSVARDKIKELEHITTQQSQQLQDLINRVNYTTAFTAVVKQKLFVKVKQVIVFSDVVTQEGEGYNANTGIFTAPKSGLYAFHLVITAGENGCKVNINLLAKDIVVGRLEVITTSYEDQSSISVIVDLSTGDEVKVAANYFSCPYIYAGRYSLFSGYLIKAH